MHATVDVFTYFSSHYAQFEWVRKCVRVFVRLCVCVCVCLCWLCATIVWCVRVCVAFPNSVPPPSPPTANTHKHTLTHIRRSWKSLLATSARSLLTTNRIKFFSCNCCDVDGDSALAALYTYVVPPSLTRTLARWLPLSACLLPFHSLALCCCICFVPVLFCSCCCCCCFPLLCMCVCVFTWICT